VNEIASVVVTECERGLGLEVEVLLAADEQLALQPMRRRAVRLCRIAPVQALLLDRGRTPALGATLSAKLPTGDYRHLDGSGSFDWSLALRLSKRLGRFTWHGGYSRARLGPWRLAPAVDVRDSRSLFAACVFAATPDTSLILQARRSSSPFPFRQGNDLGRVAMDVMAGFRHRLPKRIDLEWSLIENIDSYYNTIDVGVFFGIALPLGPPAPPAAGAGLQPTTR